MKDIVIVGLGQLGGVFARGFLRSGYRVVPVNRGDDLAHMAALAPEPELVLVTVGEGDLPAVLAELPTSWRSRAGLVQNELLPRDWRAQGVDTPTVAVVWFEKKAGRGIREILPTVVAGPKAALVEDALREIGLSAERVEGESALEEALVLKNLYILVSNIAGIETGGTVSGLWSEHRALAEAVAHEVFGVQEALIGRALPRERLIASLQAAFEADPEHGCRGRSAPRRRERMLAHAAEFGIDVPTVQAIRPETPG